MLLCKVFRYINQLLIVYTLTPAALDPGEGTLPVRLEVNVSRFGRSDHVDRLHVCDNSNNNNATITVAHN